jgi:hypothetical protein
MKRVAVWLILISYSLMACGDMLGVGCCRNEAGHAASEYTAHQHAHSKVLVAVHSLVHWSPPGDSKHLVSQHCCCVKQGEQDPGLPPHSLTPQFSTPNASDFPSRAIPPGGLDIPATGPSAGSTNILDKLDSEFILRSIHSTILLI